jgi:capsular polysaccharide biosynthesis protein
MNEQKLDLRGSIQMVRRHRRLFGASVALGLLLGAGYAALDPPMLTSTALVLVQSGAQSTQDTTTGTEDPVMATQAVIADSSAVLSAALPHISGGTSLQALENKVQVGNVAGSILSISGTGLTAGQAEVVANAVANSYVAYVGQPGHPAGGVSASVLEPATTASGTKLAEQIAIYALLGMLAGAFLGFIAAISISRRDRRLVARDAIANSIAVPVLISLPAEKPSDAGSWAKLLDEYEPAAVHAWAISNLLQRFGLDNPRLTAGSPGSCFSLTILSLAADPGALALGPQLAAYAAHLGVTTALVVGPQQDVNAVATLRTACGAANSAPGRHKPLRLIVCDDGQLGQLRAAFVVVVAVINGQDPRVPDTVRTTGTVLGVSAGAVTAEQLARAATAAAADGREIFGILVANPDPGDQTTGRIPRLGPSLRRPMPTRISDVPMELQR